jgi:hypothetical protein
MFARRTATQRDPVIPPGVTADGLDREVLAELRGLGRGLAADVGAHLAAVALFINDDPERAWSHAIAARRMAARLGVVRETAGLAAYRAGLYSDALAELRTARRMTGSNVHLPVMADCERGLGRPERALEILQGDEAGSLGRDGRIELAIVESGARTDLGQLDAAVVAVRLPELEAKDSPTIARLRYAYSEALRATGDTALADTWHRRALAADRDGSAGIPAPERSGYDDDDYLEDDEYEDDEILDLEAQSGDQADDQTDENEDQSDDQDEDEDDDHDHDHAPSVTATDPFSEPAVAEPVIARAPAAADLLFAEPAQEQNPAPGQD